MVLHGHQERALRLPQLEQLQMDQLQQRGLVAVMVAQVCQEKVLSIMVRLGRLVET